MKYKRLYLGLEFGSTRIKATLINEKCDVIALGTFHWQNKLIDGIWTYSHNEIISGMQKCYHDLKNNFYKITNSKLTHIDAIGISAMMHGYIALNKDDKLLVPFRTWRNTTTAQASNILSTLFNFNIPQRWSIAHLYQAILNKESHINQINYLTTLSGYIHYLLTGQKFIGIGDASGMFPINSKTKTYDETMLNTMECSLKKHKVTWNLTDILPKIKLAGGNAGKLTKNGAKLLDPSGDLKDNVSFCPCEGDAGTGMVATNAIKPFTGNVSGGTSIFAMIVLQKMMKRYYEEVDMVTTPDGLPVAMIHCNTCSTDIDAWINIFDEYNALFKTNISKSDIYKKIFHHAIEQSDENSGIVSFNYYSGEPIMRLNDGRPLLMYHANSKFNLANLFKTFLMSCFATLAIGFTILENENVKIRNVVAHGGIFHVENTCSKILSAALRTPITIHRNASEGGSFGMAVLASYLNANKQSLAKYLDQIVFASSPSTKVMATKKEIFVFNGYIKLFKEVLPVEQQAIKLFNL